MLIPKSKRIRDKKYLQSYKDKTCEAAARGGYELCGKPAVGAHIRVGNEGGRGLKPSDDLTLALCHECHTAQETGGYEWLVEHILKPQLRRRYKKWKNNI